jgi:hypothetical protein
MQGGQVGRMGGWVVFCQAAVWLGVVLVHARMVAWGLCCMCLQRSQQAGWPQQPAPLQIAHAACLNPLHRPRNQTHSLIHHLRKRRPHVCAGALLLHNQTGFGAV